MRKIATPLLIVMLLVPGWSQAAEGRASNANPEIINPVPAEVRVVAEPTLAPEGILLSGMAHSKELGMRLGEQDAPPQAPPRHRTRSALLGTVIGLATGTAVYALYFMGTNCHYGSDSMSVLMTQCVALPGAAFIGGGAMIGRAIGKAADRRRQTAP